MGPILVPFRFLSDRMEQVHPREIFYEATESWCIYDYIHTKRTHRGTVTEDARNRLRYSTVINYVLYSTPRYVQ